MRFDYDPGDNDGVRETGQRERENMNPVTAMSELLRASKSLPQMSEAEVIRRASRFAPSYDAHEISAIFAAYRERPHVCHVAVDHTLGGRCAKGLIHEGCCPGEHARLIRRNGILTEERREQ